MSGGTFVTSMLIIEGLMLTYIGRTLRLEGNLSLEVVVWVVASCLWVLLVIAL